MILQLRFCGLFVVFLSILGADLTAQTTSAPVITSPLSVSVMAMQLSFSYQITATNNPTSYAASGPGTFGGDLTLDPSTGIISGYIPNYALSDYELTPGPSQARTGRCHDLLPQLTRGIFIPD